MKLRSTVYGSFLISSTLTVSNAFHHHSFTTSRSSKPPSLLDVHLRQFLSLGMASSAYSYPNPPYLGTNERVEPQATSSKHSIEDDSTGATTTTTISTTTTTTTTSGFDNMDKQTTITTTTESSNANAKSSLQLPSNEGIYQLKTEEDYKMLLDAYPDKLVIIKFFATYCRACKEMAPKLLAVKRDPQLQGLPLVWAEFPAQRTTKELFQKKLRVITLPTIHFYDGGSTRGLVENFPCPPQRIPLLKKKLARFINARVDHETLQLIDLDKPSPTGDMDAAVSGGAADSSADDLTATEPRVKRNIIIDNEMITEEHIDYLRNGMPFFQDLSDDEFEQLLQKARLLTFNRGDVIVKQGMAGDTFYVVKSGLVEMFIKSRFEDPIRTPSQYLGVQVATLEKFDYFGERALTTGEPLSASFRVLEKARCFAFSVDDIPESSILSKKRRATQDFVEKLNQRYILPEDYTPSYLPVTPQDECILDLLVRFKQIRQAAMCFDYVMEIAEPIWGDAGEIARRTLLVGKLSKAQRSEFNEVFDMIDVRQRGAVSLLEMRQFMQSARQFKTDRELVDMMDRANSVGRKSPTPALSINRDEFLGVMAEAAFYNLFKETFQELDAENTGYVRAGDLDDVLGGVRNLIAVDAKPSIIDVDDKDMLVDYEQFSKMLLGAAL